MTTRSSLMREDDRTGVSETRPDWQYRMPVPSINSVRRRNPGILSVPATGFAGAPKDVQLMTRCDDLELSHGATAKVRENAVKQDRVRVANAFGHHPERSGFLRRTEFIGGTASVAAINSESREPRVSVWSWSPWRVMSWLSRCPSSQAHESPPPTHGSSLSSRDDCPASPRAATNNSAGPSRRPLARISQTHLGGVSSGADEPGCGSICVALRQSGPGLIV